MARSLLVLILLAGPTTAEEPLWTSCRETVDGRMALEMDPKYRDDQEAIQRAIRSCRMVINYRNELDAATGSEGSSMFGFTLRRGE